MAYTDFAYYSETYKGTMTEVNFNRLCEVATAHINAYTFDKAITYTGTDSKLKRACCSVCDVLLKDESGGDKTAESLGGYSVSFATVTKSVDYKIKSAIKLYLGTTGLMFGGG